MHPEIAEQYGNRVRIRVCGLCWQQDLVLMVKHKMGNSPFWAPPGGGIEFGETVEDAIKREFLEETGLSVQILRFQFGCEFINGPLHAIELFYEVNALSGTLVAGKDPELQIIDEVQFLSIDEILQLPPDSSHGIFRISKNAVALRQMTGFYRI